MLQDEIDKWKTKSEDAEDRRITEVQEIKDRCEDILRREQDIMKRNFAEKEENYQFQIRQLKKIVHEKETVENVVSNKVAKVREEKDA